MLKSDLHRYVLSIGNKVESILPFLLATYLSMLLMKLYRLEFNAYK